MFGISRIDQPEKHNHLWYLRLTINGALMRRSFSDQMHGSRRKALEAAQNFRDAVFYSKFTAKQQERAAKKRKPMPKRK